MFAAPSIICADSSNIVTRTHTYFPKQLGQVKVLNKNTPFARVLCCHSKFDFYISCLLRHLKFQPEWSCIWSASEHPPHNAISVTPAPWVNAHNTNIGLSPESWTTTSSWLSLDKHRDPVPVLANFCFDTGNRMTGKVWQKNKFHVYNETIVCVCVPRQPHFKLSPAILPCFYLSNNITF